MGNHSILNQVKCQKKKVPECYVYDVGIIILYHKILHFTRISDEIFYINVSFIYQSLAEQSFSHQGIYIPDIIVIQSCKTKACWWISVC